MKLFSKNEVNTSRQFEFDLAKAVCILGMVIIHCLEEFPLTEAGYDGSLYYIFQTVLDALFGAGTFMICLGIGISYTNKNKPDDFIKRGLITILFGYILNIFRFVLPGSLYFFSETTFSVWKYLLSCLIYTDIMQFAGLAFLLFGLLKKIKLPDWGIAIIAIVMSIIGSFVRFINVGNIHCNQLLGLFIGTVDESGPYLYYAPFALINWFIIVIFGYFFGKLLKRVENIELFYAITTAFSFVVIVTYMIIAIPNRYGMMCGDTIYYFQMRTWESLIIMMGAVLMFGIYHYISKLFNDKIKKFITGLAVNINKTYCIHWVTIGLVGILLWAFFEDGLESYVIVIIALVIYVFSSILAEVVRKKQEKKKRLKNDTKLEN